MGSAFVTREIRMCRGNMDFKHAHDDAVLQMRTDIKF